MNENTLFPAVVEDDRLSQYDAESSMETPKRVGLSIFALVFVVFGGWSALAPLNSAAVAPGMVVVESYKKIIQHYEGGIVKEILVRNGDYVTSAQALIVLDDTQAAAQLEITYSQFLAFKTKEARLIAERDNLDNVEFPESVTNLNLDASEEMNAQRQIFTARKNAKEGEVEVLQQRIEQLQTSVTGLRALRESKEELAASFSEELQDIEALLAQGFSDKRRLREVKRNYSSHSGEAAQLTANISAAEVQIGETRLLIIQQGREFLNQVVAELSDTQNSLRDINERIIALEDIVSRMTIRAPDDGIVNGMQVHSVGAVVQPASPIAEIVPQTSEFIVEARVSLIDIDRVSEGQEATVRFSAFGSSVPTIYGTVIGLSADALTDPNTGASYYLARIEVTPEGMTELGDLVLLPGMPADAFITTGSRTFIQYLMKPFSNALARSFIED